MKKLFLTIALAASLSASADDYAYLTAQYGGVEQSIELATVRTISFEQDLVVVTTSEARLTFPLAEMQKMYFSATATAIDRLPSETDSLKVIGGVLHVVGQKGIVRVYASNGTLQHVAQVEGRSSISLQSLPKGVYFIQLGNQVIKVSK